MLQDAWNATLAPIPGPRTQPAEEERREEHGQARRLADRREMAQREDDARDDQRRADRGSEDADTTRQRLVEPRLEVAAIEGLLRQRDDDELTEDLVDRVPGLHVEPERAARMPERPPAEEERDERDRRERERPRHGGTDAARETTTVERPGQHEAAERETRPLDPRVVAPPHERPRRAEEEEPHRRGDVAIRQEGRSRGDDAGHDRGCDDGLDQRADVELRHRQRMRAA